jgi:serine/threonine protein kinase
MKKGRILLKKSIQTVMNELNVLSEIKSNFIVNAHYAFQDTMNLYLVMDLMLGGDLSYHMKLKGVFNEE